MLADLILDFPLLTLVLAGILSWMLFYKDKKTSRIHDLMLQFPGPKILPVIGSCIELNVSNDKLVELQYTFAKRYGSRMSMKAGPGYYVNLADGEDIEKVFSNSAHINKSHLYGLLWPWLGTGLLTSQGKKWHTRRKMLTPAFHFKVLEDFLPIFNEQSSILIDIIRDEFGGGQVRDVCPYITRCVLDTICETAMGKKLNSQHSRDTPYVIAVHRMCDIIAHRVVRPWLYLDIIWRFTSRGWQERKNLKILHEFTTRVIQERKIELLAQLKLEQIDKENQNYVEVNQTAGAGIHAVGKNGEGKTILNEKTTVGNGDIYWKGKRRLAFLDLLIEAQRNPENNLTDNDLREEVDTFMFEGHDTLSANLNWTLFLLGAYKEHQVKVQEELNEIFGDDRKRPVTTQDLTRMKYLEMCIKESLRLYPSVPIMARYLNTDCVLDDGVIIPAGATVVILPSLVHRNENVYPEPNLFSPERFLPENCVGRHPFSYIPFSAGPRNCIGQKFAMMEAKVICAQILRNFTIEATQRPEDVVVMAELITRARDGLPLRFIPIQ